MPNSQLETLKTIWKSPPMIQFIIHFGLGLYLAINTLYNPLIFIDNIFYIPATPGGVNGLWIIIFFYFVTFFMTIVNLYNRRFIKKIMSQEYKELYNEFYSDGMNQKIRKVCDWKERNPEPGEYKRQLKTIESNSDFEKVHLARRYISQFYRKIWEHDETWHLITSNEVKRLVTKDRIKILLEIIEPLEEEIGEDYDKIYFNYFRNIK